MQPCDSTFFSVLENVTASNPRDLTWLFEFYDPATTPGANGLDPAAAVQRFASIELTWLGLAYRRAVLSAGSITKAKGSQANRCTLKLSNADENRYAANWVNSTTVEGMRLVVRLFSRSASTTLAASNQRFSGRCDKPEGFDAIQGSVSATEDVGGDDVEFPPRAYLADDPEGRSPADPLNEGFPLVTLQGTFQYRRLEPDRDYSRRDPRRYFGTLPYSSYDDTPLGEPIPMVLGRTQMRLSRGIFLDEGFITRCLDFACMGPMAGFLNFRMENPPSGPVYFNPPENVTYHLGEAGGTGTQTHDPLWPNHPYFSYTAYIGYRFRGIFPGAATTINAGEATVATVLGLLTPLPDGAGVYNQTGWSDDGADQTYLLLTGARFFGHNPAFLEDSSFVATRQYNQEPLVDVSNSGLIYIPDPEAAAAGVLFQRYRSTALINAARAKYALGLSPDRPESLPVGTGDFDPFDPFDPPLIPTEVVRLCKRFTSNVILKKRVKAKDFLFKTLFTSFRAYLVMNWRGKWDLRSERPADFAHLRAASVAGATQILVEDVTPWKAAGGLWGQILLGTPLTTSEARKVSAAVYTSDANTITLSASKTGAVTVAASGATLSGGSSVAKATGTVTVGGAPAAGNTVTVIVNGIAVTYTVESAETAATVAYMVAAHINANTQLRRFVSAVAAGAVVTISSKWGVLTLSAALVNGHGGPVSNPTVTPAISPFGSGSSLAAGTYRVAHADRNANGSTYISPYATVTLTAGQNILVNAMTLPAGVTSRDWFVSKGAGDPEMVLYANRDGAAFQITAPPSSTATFPPEYNTTGEELVRVALPFASNNQTAAILAQTNLTRGNIFEDSYKWPGGREQASYTETVGTYVSAKDDFAESKVIIVDNAKRARLGRRSPKELDLTAVDNYHQARRLVYFDSARFIDHHWFNQLSSNGLGLLLEEGDLICASDDSGGHVNVLTQVEEFTIHLADFTVSIGRARLYSTDMFRELVPRTRPLLPSVLRWVTTLPTVWEFIDVPPVWDGDANTPGFYAVGTFDLATPGDWQGWSLWADLGDGFKRMAESDFVGTIGTTTNHLSAGSAAVYDETSTLTVVLKNGELTSLSRDDIFASGKANLAIYGDELIQFTGVTLVDAATRTYTVGPGILRGRFGTSALAHADGERFALMAGATLVPLDIRHVNAPHDFKGVTVNQDVADATPVSKTWTGGTQKLPAPAQLSLSRLAANELYAEWVRVARFGGGLRDRTRVPVGEDEITFDVETYTASTLRGTYHVKQPPVQVAELLDRSTINSAGTPTDMRAVTRQSLDPDESFFAAVIPFNNVGFLGSESVGLSDEYTYRAVDDGAGGTFHSYGWQVSVTVDGGFGLGVIENGVTVYSQGVGYSGDDPEVYIELRDGRIHYYLNRQNDSDLPLYSSSLTNLRGRDLRGRLFSLTSGAGLAYGAHLRSSQPFFRYTADMQTADGITPGATVTFRVYQVGGYGVRGPYAEGSI